MIRTFNELSSTVVVPKT